MSKPPPPPRSVAPAAAPSGKLEELGADDILECDDIEALEAAADAIVTTTFDVEVDPPAPASSNAASFEVAELAPFSDPQVEGSVATADDSEPDPTVIGSFVPPAPATSPMLLESSIEAQPVVDRTLELKDGTLAKVEAAAAALAEPDQTEVLARSSMPPALQAPHGGAYRPVSTPPPAHAQPTRGRAGSIAPVAFDVADRPMRPLAHAMPAIPAPGRLPSFAAPARRGPSGLAIGGIAAAAVVLLGLVGAGGYAGSRALSARRAPVSIASSPSELAPAVAPAAGPEQSSGATSAAEPSAPASAVDVSSLPTASPRGAASPRSHSRAASAPASSPAPVARSSHGTLPAPVAPGPKPTSSTPSPASQASPRPVGAPLPPPPSRAPAAAPVVASTGVVQVDPGARVVVVDGVYRRTSDGALTIACGWHRIKVGMGEQQTLNVPCGGSITVR